MSNNKAVYYQRWNLQHRLQHISLVISMIGLLWTGMAMKFYTEAWAKGTFRIFTGFHGTLIVHKISAALLILVSVWHLSYLLTYLAKHGVKEAGPRSWAMLPGLKDFIDAKDHALYLLKLSDKPPQYDRYSYLEKFEYLSIFWGMAAMGLSGAALWFPEVAAQWIPRSWLDGLRLIHTNEALVALIALAYGHLFTAHFNPIFFPQNSMYLTGKISLEHMLEEHPAEYARLASKGDLPAMAGSSHEHGLTGWRWGLGAVELIIYSAVFYYLLYTFIPKLLA
ncbi:MAG: formate dehydrogenase subunit gamma [Mycobacterium leprae]